MAEKRDPGRFTIKFNMEDPNQRSAVEILNQQGRQKAQFLTAAVLHYLHCSETPEFQPMPAVDTAAIEKIVLEVLERNSRQRPSTMPVAAPTAGTAPAEELPADLKELFGASGMEAIANTLAAFQHE
jgi:hypothetical protein